MRHRIMKVFGFGIVGVIIVGLFLEVALAIKGGHAFYGTNYKGLPLGVTYPIVIAVIVGGVGIWVWAGRAYSAFKQRRRK